MKKAIINISLSLLVVLLLVIGYYFYNNERNREILINNKHILTDINKHYNKYVTTTKKANLYKKEHNQYKKIGTISKGVNLVLKDTIIKLNTKYIKIKGTDYYIYYKDIKKIDEFVSDERYKNYIYFQEKLKTKSNFSLYDDYQEVYHFNESMDFQILIKDDYRYGVIYNHNLYYVLNEDISNIYNNEVQVLEKALSIPVTVYHFLYLEGEECGEIICNSIKQVREEFDYLKENHYFTMNTKEMEYFINGKINLPKNSILITIDDGARATNFLPLLDEYQINATLFLISSWYKTNDFESRYLELASHTHNLHTPGVCEGGQGSPLKCMDKNELIRDLKLSRETLNNTEAFCFPFYEYNQYSIDVLKEVGFKTAYVGGDKKASLGINNYVIPRITIHHNISLNHYINLIQ